MEALEVTGRTVEEATEKALQQLGVGREDVEVVVVDKGRAGILGIGSGEARVRVTLRQIDVVDYAKETIEGLLRHMGVAATVGFPENPPSKAPGAPEGNLSFEIDGEDAGLLIGRRGETLSALQYLVNAIVSRKAHERVLASIDVEGYKARRNEALRALALRMAERVAQTGRTFTMEPMPARERRIIHLALTNHPRVLTQSVGEGDTRKLTIVPKRTGARYPDHRHQLERPAPPEEPGL